MICDGVRGSEEVEWDFVVRGGVSLRGSRRFDVYNDSFGNNNDSWDGYVGMRTQSTTKSVLVERVYWFTIIRN